MLIASLFQQETDIDKNCLKNWHRQKHRQEQKLFGKHLRISTISEKLTYSICRTKIWEILLRNFEQGFAQ